MSFWEPHATCYSNASLGRIWAIAVQYYLPSIMGQNLVARVDGQLEGLEDLRNSLEEK
jgi:hypothetical protein